MGEIKRGDSVFLIDSSDNWWYGEYEPNGPESRCGIAIQHESDGKVTVQTRNGIRHWRTTDIKLIKEKTMDNLQVGDVLVSSFGAEKEVLAVIDKVVIVDDGDDDACCATYITSKLAEDGYTIKGQEEPKELTVEEISKELGYDVKVVKG